MSKGKYKKLIGKIIENGFEEKLGVNIIMNSLKITDITYTNKAIELIGKIYECKIDWENKYADGAYPILEFDEKTLDELLDNGVSYHIMGEIKMFFRIAKTKEVTKEKYFIIRNSQNPNQYLKPYPNQDSKQYIWAEELLGIAGFSEKDAKEIAPKCMPAGIAIPMDSLTKNIYKE